MSPLPSSSRGTWSPIAPPPLTMLIFLHKPVTGWTLTPLSSVSCLRTQAPWGHRSLRYSPQYLQGASLIFKWLNGQMGRRGRHVVLTRLQSSFHRAPLTWRFSWGALWTPVLRLHSRVVARMDEARVWWTMTLDDWSQPALPCFTKLPPLTSLLFPHLRNCMDPRGVHLKCWILYHSALGRNVGTLGKSKPSTIWAGNPPLSSRPLNLGYNKGAATSGVGSCHL